MKIELFNPPRFELSMLDFEYLSSCVEKQLIYASKGRYAIGHILKASNLSNKKILVSPYMCDSVFRELEALGMEVLFYDIDTEDMNPLAGSVDRRIDETDAGVVIAPSIYGNAADMVQIEYICKENKVLLIDDAAQSFGSKLNDRWIGTFGNGGLWAFSPGKATAGHMGALFWTDNDHYEIRRTHHPFAHWMAWKDFKINRLNAYKSGILSKNVVSKVNAVTQHFSDIQNDDMEIFEKEIMGGIINGVLNGNFSFRKEELQRFTDEFSDISAFRVIQSKRGEPNPHKIVLVFERIDMADRFKQMLNINSISYFQGYDLERDEYADLRGAQSVKNKIIELPIEKDRKHMDYIYSCVDSFVRKI